jgi:hypothetical protein
LNRSRRISWRGLGDVEGARPTPAVSILAEPLPYIADLTRAALEFVAGSETLGISTTFTGF